MAGTPTSESQKKKSEPVVLATTPTSQNGNADPQSKVTEAPVEEKTSSQTIETVTSTELPEKSVEVNPELLSTSAHDAAIPSLKGIHAMKQKASQQHEEDKKKIPQLQLAQVQDFWKEFSENHSSQSLRLTMNEAIVDIKGDKMIIIRTGNQTGKNRLTAETNLLDGLRSLIRIPDLQIVVEIDPELDKSKELVKPKKLLTSREKFEILSAKNPLIHELRDKLDLIPDQDE
jgi:hypothetical protein